MPTFALPAQLDRRALMCVLLLAALTLNTPATASPAEPALSESALSDSADFIVLSEGLASLLNDSGREFVERVAERAPETSGCATRISDALVQARASFVAGDLLPALHSLASLWEQNSGLDRFCDDVELVRAALDFELSLRAVLGDHAGARRMAGELCHMAATRDWPQQPESVSLIEEVCDGGHRALGATWSTPIEAGRCVVAGAQHGRLMRADGDTVLRVGDGDTATLYFRCPQSGETLWQMRVASASPSVTTLLMPGNALRCGELQALLREGELSADQEFVARCEHRHAGQTRDGSEPAASGYALLRQRGDAQALLLLEHGQPSSSLHGVALRQWLAHPLAELQPTSRLQAMAPPPGAAAGTDELASPRPAVATAFSFLSAGAVAAAAVNAANLSNARQARNLCRESEAAFCARDTTRDELDGLVRQRRAGSIAAWSASAVLTATTALLWKRYAQRSRRRDLSRTEMRELAPEHTADEEWRASQAFAPPPQ